MNVVYIGLGSNIEPRKQYLDEAIERLEINEAIDIVATSSVYETAPVDYTNQAHFLNMVVKIETKLESTDLLSYCQRIELELGRDRSAQAIEKGPRTIDLDILLFNEETIRLNHLTVPHPRMHERAFVIVPLHEIAPKQMIPTIEKSVETVLKKLPDSEIVSVIKWDHS